MGYRELSVQGLKVIFRNVPGSAITRVTVAGSDAFGFDPDLDAFVDFVEGQRVNVTPDLAAGQVHELRQELTKHCRLRAGLSA